MKTEIRTNADVPPYERNPRINDNAVDVVAASIREFEFRQPIVTDVDGVIICGHTRYKAALKLRLETVLVHVAKKLLPEHIKADRMAGHKGWWCVTPSIVLLVVSRVIGASRTTKANNEQTPRRGDRGALGASPVSANQRTCWLVISMSARRKQANAQGLYGKTSNQRLHFNLT